MSKDTGQKAIGEAYETEDEIVILGDPPDLGPMVADDDPRQHNCDAMGCGQAHVLYRFRKPNAGHHDGAAPAPSVDGVVGTSNQKGEI